MIYHFLQLPHQYFHTHHLHFYPNINFIKPPIIPSHQITPLTPTYKQQIQYQFFPHNLHPLLRKYNDNLSRIVNPIDT
ncbi:glycogen/starch synthase, partial [Bacillus thuringiensis]|uniref:glycogen/starch synthase n=1 Tax=Bacillus thuringiensis TaxID=1428 RepID=UPI003BFA75EF